MEMRSIKVRDAVPGADAETMLTIYAPFIESTSITFEETVPTVRAFAERVQSTQGAHPWIVAEVDGVLAGYAYASAHRTRASYRWCVESSIYVNPAQQTSGIGRVLYQELFRRLRRQNYCNVYAGIAIPNPASVGFHTALGFRSIGTYAKVGYKMRQWHDVLWMEFALGEHPQRPLEPTKVVSGQA
mgnify:CR=1 FL=1